MRCLRLTLVGLLILRGVATVVFFYPFADDRRRARLRQRWSQSLLGILGVRLDADIRHVVPGCMVVANHISWLDIFIINAAAPAAFVSKADVRRWPVIGWLAAMNETVFLQRGSRGHARQINAAIAEKLDAGKCVAVFPEGTTTDGLSVLHFHAALLQPALTAERPVVPLAISYWEASGERSLVPRYDGDISFGQSISAIASSRGLTARLRSIAPLENRGADRREVAATARAAIIADALPARRTPPGIPGDLRDAPPSVDCPTDSRNPAREDSVTV